MSILSFVGYELTFVGYVLVKAPSDGHGNTDCLNNVTLGATSCSGRYYMSPYEHCSLTMVPNDWIWASIRTFESSYPVTVRRM